MTIVRDHPIIVTLLVLTLLVGGCEYFTTPEEEAILTQMETQPELAQEQLDELSGTIDSIQARLDADAAADVAALNAEERSTMEEVVAELRALRTDLAPKVTPGGIVEGEGGEGLAAGENLAATAAQLPGGLGTLGLAATTLLGLFRAAHNKKIAVRLIRGLEKAKGADDQLASRMKQNESVLDRVSGPAANDLIEAVTNGGNFLPI